jgi:16S rRNA C967 or C1407 C5-methylase (RsmB/RsmF family)
VTSLLPTAFLERLERILPAAQLDAFLHAQARPPATGFRANTLKTNAPALATELAEQDFTLTPLTWPPDTFTIPQNQRRALTQTDACRQGRLYIQNPSSMLPPLILAPQPTEEILDLTAAPGSKTTQLAALMGNQGRIAAVERSRPRFFRLKANLKPLGQPTSNAISKTAPKSGAPRPNVLIAFYWTPRAQVRAVLPTIRPPIKIGKNQRFAASQLNRAVCFFRPCNA